MATKKTIIEINDQSLTNALRALAKLTGASFDEVIRFETKKILESAVKKTRAAQVKLIQENTRSASVRTLPNGKTYLVKTTDEKWSQPKGWDRPAPNGWKLPDMVWAMVQKQVADSIKRRKAARGLAKKSWMQVAESLGMKIAVPAFVSKANANGKDYPRNATALERNSGPKFFIEGTNTRLYDPKMASAIGSAIAGRVSYFKKNLQKGVFKKTSDIAARYPGLSVTY